MKPLALPKSLLLKKPWEYRKVYQEGKRVRSPRLTIIYRANGGSDCRLGISIHGIKSAVRRNRIKRIIREFFRLERHFINPAADVVFAVRDGFAPDSLLEVKQLVEKVLRRGGPTASGEQAPAVSAASASQSLPLPLST